MPWFANPNKHSPHSLRISDEMTMSTIGMNVDSNLCLRQGYQCKCETCQIWIQRWNRELEAFATITRMIDEGKTLFQIYEFLRAEQPDILRLHHQSIEKQYIELKKTTTVLE